MKFTSEMKEILKYGLHKGTGAALQLFTIMVPVSFAVAVLQWTGALAVVSAYLSPVFALVGLPGSCAFAYLSGALLNCYSAIAVMATLPLSGREITILSLMVLIAHNLPVEVSVQHRAGGRGAVYLVLRLAASFLSGIVLNRIMPPGVGAGTIINTAAVIPTSEGISFASMVLNWASGSWVFFLKIFLIVIGLMMITRLLERCGIILLLERIISPIRCALGLPRSVSYLWIVANVLGLAYGSAVIIGKKKEGTISDRDIRLLNASIAVCHSLFEDTVLFAAIGAAVPWIVFPRLIIAAFFVWIWRFFKKGLD